MRSQVRGGDNDKLCFSVVSDRDREMKERKELLKGTIITKTFLGLF